MDMLLLVDNYYIGASGSCSGIYCFENLIDGKPYVGQGQILRGRKTAHFNQLKNNKDSEYFQIAWNKDGKENFKFYILEECPIELLNEREVFWIAELRSYFTEWGYNKTRGGQCVRGYKHTPETIEKIREASMGQRHTEEAKQKMIDNNWIRGKHHSPETIQKIKDNKPDQSGENAPFYGKKHSPETRQKMIDNHADLSGENAPFYGKKHSPEAIQKNRDSHLGKKQSEETIQKIKESNSGINNPNILKKEIVLQIKSMLENGIYQAKIAKELGVDKNTVRKVKNNWHKDIYGI